MSKANFIRTSDFGTYQKLLEEGLKEIPSGVEGIYMFINPHSFSFDDSKFDNSKITYTNKVMI